MHGRADRLRRTVERSRTLNPRPDLASASAVGRRPCDGAGLRAAREAAGLSRGALAARSGVSAATIYRIELGGRDRPFPHTVHRLAVALAVAPGDLEA